MNAKPSWFRNRNGKNQIRHLLNPAPNFCWGCLGLLPILCVLLAGCQTSSVTRVDPGAAAYATNNLLEGDVISITFQYSTNFNTVQKIGLDGTLNLQGVGLVRAAGKTTTQLQNELTDLYKTRLKKIRSPLKLWQLNQPSMWRARWCTRGKSLWNGP